MSNKNDWVRIPGRRFKNLKTGEELSRRQFDKQFGALAQAGLTSYETKAEKNRQIEGIQQLAKPARGRKKLKEANPEKRRALLEERAEEEKEKKIEKVESRTATKKFRVPKSLSLRNFKKGRMGNKWRVSFDRDAIREFIKTASKFKGALGYTVGVEFIDDRTGKKGAATLFTLRDFSMEFTGDDFAEMIDYIMERMYIRPLNAIVYIALKKSYAERNAK